ncbi:MAG: ATP-dependent Clp protease ATP-binding subunit [Candidatus Portnoybacteria bacterium]|nr:ATP-dependent Clp protease ATP-binding subunit [Candidatus Portnoybacteria bacterium]
MNFVFKPHLNILRISQRRLRVFLGWIIIILLILFGIYGLFVFFYFFNDPKQILNTFYFSLLTDMFLFYFWQRRKEKVRKIGLDHSLIKNKEEQIDVSLFLDASAQESLEKSWMLCYRKRYHFLRPIHLFAVFVKRKDFKKILKRLNCQPDQVIEKTNKILGSSSFFPESEKELSILGPEMATDFKKIFIDAFELCLREQRNQISHLDILWVLSQQKNLVGMIFDEFGISSREIERAIQWAKLEKEIEMAERSFLWKRIFKPKGKLDRTMTAALTPLLDKVSQDLTLLARQGRFEMVLGREKEIERIFNFFSSGDGKVILVGESTIGKKAILKKIAQMMVQEEVPDFLQDKRLIQLDVSSLVSLSGAKEKGEEYLKRALFEVARAGNIVLVIENLDSLAGLKSQDSGLDFAEILASTLEENTFFFISTVSNEGFSSKIEGKILGRVLNKIEIVLPEEDLLWQILISKIFIIEKKLKVLFSVDALEQAIDSADRYIYGKSLTAKAMDLLAEAAYHAKGRKDDLIEEKDIIELVSQKTSVPLGQVQETEKEKLLQLEELIHQRLINQEEAVVAVASALRRSRIELKGKKKTVANFLFIGPTGVGKTELAKTLAQIYFGNEKRMIRLDMSEYQEKRGLRRLIGLRTDTGLEKGYLTESVKRQPYALLLLDEIEKAHPDILNLFLQVMDDGRLTDASGETINFTNIILIATSNAGTQFVQEKIRQGIAYEEIDKQLKDSVLLEHFRPEFLNRFDKIVLFKSLSMDNMIKITNLFLNDIRQGLEKKGVSFEVEREAIEELAQAGYDPLYGARPLKRVIQDKVESDLAKLFLEDKIKRRDKLILKKGLAFEIKKAIKI